MKEIKKFTCFSFFVLAFVFSMGFLLASGATIESELEVESYGPATDDPSVNDQVLNQDYHVAGNYFYYNFTIMAFKNTGENADNFTDELVFELRNPKDEIIHQDKKKISKTFPNKQSFIPKNESGEMKAFLIESSGYYELKVCSSNSNHFESFEKVYVSSDKKAKNIVSGECVEYPIETISKSQYFSYVNSREAINKSEASVNLANKLLWLTIILLVVSVLNLLSQERGRNALYHTFLFGVAALPAFISISGYDSVKLETGPPDVGQVIIIVVFALISIGLFVYALKELKKSKQKSKRE